MQYRDSSHIRTILRQLRHTLQLTGSGAIAALSIFLIQPAFAEDDVCANTIRDMQVSTSESIKQLAERIVAVGKGGFTNKSKTSHILFKSPDGEDGRLVFEYHSTTKTEDPNDPGEYEIADGSAKICDNGRGELKLVAPAFGSVQLSLPEGCFRLHILFGSSSRTTFCEGVMPSHIASARERAGGRGLAVRGLGRSPEGKGIKQ